MENKPTTEKLPPCPFCKGWMRVNCDTDGFGIISSYHAECFDCGARGPEADDVEGAIASISAFSGETTALLPTSQTGDVPYLAEAIAYCESNPITMWAEHNDNDGSLPSAGETILDAAQRYSTILSRATTPSQTGDEETAEAYKDAGRFYNLVGTPVLAAMKATGELEEKCRRIQRALLSKATPDAARMLEVMGNALNEADAEIDRLRARAISGPAPVPATEAQGALDDMYNRTCSHLLQLGVKSDAPVYEHLKQQRETIRRALQRPVFDAQMVLEALQKNHRPPRSEGVK